MSQVASTEQLLQKLLTWTKCCARIPISKKRLREVHPEICFFFLASQRPLQYSKKRKLGYEERYTLLEPRFGHWLPAVLAERHHLACTKDVVLDAFVALWTAERIANRISQTIPSDPPRDAFGLRMEMLV
jgi:predicted RNase H-like nuclease